MTTESPAGPRVLVVSVSTSAHRRGGMERHLDLLIALLKRLGAETHVLTTALPSGSSWDKAVLHTVPCRPAYDGSAWRAKSVARFRELDARHAYTRIVSEGTAAAALAPFARDRIAVFLHGFGPEHVLNRWTEVRDLAGLCRFAAVQTPETLFFSWMERTFCRKAAQVWGVSGRVAELARRCYGLPAAKVSTFHNWIEPPAPPQGRAAPKPFTFLCAAVLSRQKAVDVAVSAFLAHAGRRADTRLLVLGDGPERPSLERAARAPRFRDRIEFRGAASPDGVLRAMREEANVFVMPTRRIEGLPYAAIEAAWSGLPGLCTDRGGMREVYGDGARYIPMNAPEAASAAMDDLSGNPPLLRRMSEAARHRAEALFGPDRAAVKLAAWLGIHDA